MARPDGYPAFPTGYGGKNHPGMTLRDYFAGQAISGLVNEANDMTGPREIALAAYAIADAMLAERNKDNG